MLADHFFHEIFPLGSVIVSVAKTDGSSNATVIELKGVSMPRLMQVWDVTAERFPVGDYHVRGLLGERTTPQVTNAL
jgi:hypothetical protein